jgi:hypothetical protein
MRRFEIGARNHLLRDAGGVSFGGCVAVNSYLGDQVVQPAKFRFLGCKDIAERLKENENRKIELHALMDRAATGIGGTAVNVVVYGPELGQIDGELNLLRRTAGEKRCEAEVMAPAAPPLVSLH